MNIKEIKDPYFLKDLSISELEQLASEIRSFLIESVSKTGGHLSSNLGIVELTIAMHKVFDASKDKIIFDVGHQSYVHKILTGRANQFESLRKLGGLSGYQKRSESKYDCFEAGHTSTSLSAALGMAVARDLALANYEVIGVIGDGSMTGGMALEALNNIGYSQRKVIIILNDNEMSISQNVGAIELGLSKFRSSVQYTKAKKIYKKFMYKTALTRFLYRIFSKLKNFVKHNIIHSSIFGVLNIEYLGPVDGHDFNDLIHAFERAKTLNGPVCVHVVTKKGKGYELCENDNKGNWHGVSSFDVETGLPIKKSQPGFSSWSQVVSDALIEIAKENDQVVAITPAMKNGSKLEKFFDQFPDRSFDVGICEQHATTLAAGMAANGLRPFLSLYSSFLQRSYDQVNHDIARMDLPVVIGIDRAGLVGEDGDTHHGVFDIGLLRALPNCIICMGANSQETRNLLYTGFNQDHPYFIRYPRGNTLVKNEKFELVKIGSWRKLNNVDVIKGVLIGYGPMIEKFDFSDILVVDARFIKPLDTQMLDEFIAQKLKLVIFEQDNMCCGFSSAVLEYLQEKNAQELLIKRIGIKDHYVTFGTVDQLNKIEKIDYESVLEQISILFGGD